MATMEQLRAALAATLVSVPKLQESAYLLSNPTPPAAEVEPGQIDYDLAMNRGADKWHFILRVFVGLTADIAAQKKLDTFIDPTGPSSIKTLVEVDRTLGGVCDFVRIVKCSGYRSYERHGGTGLVLGAEWSVEVLASN
jgi:hypothetical protein